MLHLLFALFLASASTISIMATYVDKERVAGERRMDALFAKKTEILCPGYNQKGMSLCVRQYIKNEKIETASSYIALSHLVSVAGTQDSNAKIYDEASAQMIGLETLVVLQEQLKRDNMVCAKLQPSGARNLLEVKQVCEQEEKQFLSQQEKNKRYIQKQIVELMAKLQNYKQPKIKQWLLQKKVDVEKAVNSQFDKSFFSEDERKITAKDILHQHRLTIQTSCDKLEPQYKARFNKQNPCELMFSQLFLSCIDMSAPRSPASLKEKEIVELVQRPLPCFYPKMQEYLTSGENSAP
jgi:hypothetical protein